jgi:hypothetical protein
MLDTPRLRQEFGQPGINGLGLCAKASLKNTPEYISSFSLCKNRKIILQAALASPLYNR